VRRIQDQRWILSTSPRTVFPPPRVIVFLAQREEEQRLTVAEHAEIDSESTHSSSTSSVATSTPHVSGGASHLRLTGVDKTALGSVLGWESREARGKGMIGVKGFVRHQGLTVLYAEKVMIGGEKHICSRPMWITYRYWSRYDTPDASADQSIGEFIERACDKTVVQERCEIEGCGKLRGEHSMSWTCGGVNVTCSLSENAGSGPEESIDVWQSCAVCGKSTEHESMNDGT
jgi:1-phosphatidylinositol-3-phosphate 5-kinase